MIEIKQITINIEQALSHIWQFRVYYDELICKSDRIYVSTA
jgi:hypothetical protein